MSMKPVGSKVYLHPNGTYYGRYEIDGRRTFRRLEARTVRAAQDELRRKESQHGLFPLGLAPVDPLAKKTEPPKTVAAIAALWEAAKYPDRHLRPMTGRSLDAAEANLRRLVVHFGAQLPDALTLADCDAYYATRAARVRRGCDGGRAVKLELTTLSTLLRWAQRCGHCRTNPLASGIPTYTDPSKVRNCNEVMPVDDAELHLLAGHLLADPRSEVLGWQLLLEALTGCRTGEILALRWDATKTAATASPGYIDATALYVQRAKRGIYPYVLIEPAPGVAPLRDLLTALRHWRAVRHPTSPWMLPGRDPSQPLDVCSLTHALTRLTRKLGLPHRTSHGLRAYYVRVSRALGIDDSEIAKRLGQRSGVGLVERVYGRSEPGWFGSKALDWLPDAPAKPAWSPWTPDAKANIVPFKAA